jgi:hypothetical protein
MMPSANILPPPEGLDIVEIASEAGLLTAIEREVGKMRNANQKGGKINRDQIRLISFLAGEVRRRIDSLTPEQKEELQDVREKANERAVENSIRDIAADIQKFAEEITRQDTAIPLASFTVLEIRMQNLKNAADLTPRHYAKFMEQLKDAEMELDDIKKLGVDGFVELT